MTLGADAGIVVIYFKMALVVFHAAIVGLNSYTLWYDQNFINIPLGNEEIKKLPFNSRVVFLTLWTLSLQTIYYSIALLNDIIGTNAAAPKNAPLIRKIKDLLFSLALPSAVYVSSAFWTIYHLDKDLIFPDHIEILYPRWVNHVMHTFVLVFILLELMLSNITYPEKKYGVSLNVLYFGGYLLWTFKLYFDYSYWVYPVMAFFNWPQRIAFASFSFASSIFLYFVGEKIINIFVRKPKKGKSKQR